MKVRNKKTGETGQIGYVATQDGQIIVEDISGEEYPYSVICSYKSLAELNEEWEDYILAKPLIEDEAKRSVFKAWAEILGRDLEKADFKYDAERNGFDCYLAESIIEFANGEGINCADREIYTFRALCGEEEE